MAQLLHAFYLGGGNSLLLTQSHDRLPQSGVGVGGKLDPDGPAFIQSASGLLGAHHFCAVFQFFQHKWASFLGRMVYPVGHTRAIWNYNMETKLRQAFFRKSKLNFYCIPNGLPFFIPTGNFLLPRASKETNPYKYEEGFL